MHKVPEDWAKLYSPGKQIQVSLQLIDIREIKISGYSIKNDISHLFKLTVRTVIQYVDETSKYTEAHPASGPSQEFSPERHEQSTTPFVSHIEKIPQGSGKPEPIVSTSKGATENRLAFSCSEFYSVK